MGEFVTKSRCLIALVELSDAGILADRINKFALDHDSSVAVAF